MSAKYSLDTSAIIGMFRRRFPPDVVPGFWPRFEKLVASGAAVCIDEVHFELKTQGGDEAEKFVAARPQMVRPTTLEILSAVGVLVNAYPIVKPSSTTKNHADAFVVALAQLEGMAVVSDEQSEPKSKLIKLPDLCAKLGIPHLSVFDLARDQGWKFQ